MKPNSSNDLPRQPLREDTARETREAVVEDANKTDVAGRDLVHGDGGTIGLTDDQPPSRDD